MRFIQIVNSNSLIPSSDSTSMYSNLTNAQDSKKQVQLSLAILLAVVFVFYEAAGHFFSKTNDKYKPFKSQLVIPFVLVICNVLFEMHSCSEGKT